MFSDVSQFYSDVRTMMHDYISQLLFVNIFIHPMKIARLLAWLPRPPGFNPVDYSMSGQLREMIYGENISTRQELIDKILFLVTLTLISCNGVSLVLKNCLLERFLIWRLPRCNTNTTPDEEDPLNIFFIFIIIKNK